MPTGIMHGPLPHASQCHLASFGHIGGRVLLFLHAFLHAASQWCLDAKQIPLHCMSKRPHQNGMGIEQ